MSIFNRKTLAGMIVVVMTGLGGGIYQAHAQTGGQAAETLSLKLKEVNHVWFYFVARTEKYSYSDERIRKDSSVRLYRACGGNCRNVLAVVIDHMKASRSVKCLPGQQDVLIDIGDKDSVVYSHSGRIIRFEGKCYFNDKSIQGIVRDSGLPFDN